MVAVSKLKVEEETRRRQKVREESREDELTVEVIIPPAPVEKAAIEETGHKETIEAKRIEIPLLVPYFHAAETVTEKATRKDFEISFIMKKPVGIPKFNFWEKSDVTMKPYKKDPTMPKTRMCEIISHILNNIPEVEFENAADCKSTEVTTTFPEKLEILSEKVQNLVFVPKVVFSENSEISVRRCLKDLIFEKTVTSVDASLSITSGVEEELEFIDPIQNVLGLSSRLSIDRPALILAKKPKSEKYEYIEFLKRILREIYRVHGRGLPRPAHTTSDFDEVKQDIRADKHIWVLDIDKVEVKTRYLEDRLRELYSQNFGFLILYGSEEKLNKVKSVLKPDSPLPKCYEVSVNEEDIVFKLARVMWGRMEEVPSLFSLDTITVMLEDAYFDEVENLANDISTIINVEPSDEDEEGLGGESIIHYALKALVFRYLKNMGIDENRIKTEWDLVDGRADIFVSDPELGELVVEIETLYGTGIPMLKLRKRIESRLKRGFNLWIVIPTPQLIIYFKDVCALRKAYRKKYGDRVEFFGVDLGSQEIVRVGEIKSLLQD
ncbi:MAG: hypothetical protein OD814_000150 [Candidatus Alkanophagales archaeon MCA70_species_1]|nr:hypothetical protein [Candidatus Alkanophaga volatiphilum]